MRRVPVFVSIVSLFSLISCHKYTAPTTNTAITCTNTTSATSTNTSISSCTDPATGISIAITPPTASVIVATPIQFRAGVSGGTTNTVIWKVNGTADRNDALGTVDQSGLYNAPRAVPSPATVTVTAVSYEDPKLSVSATVTILNPPTVTISPPCPVAMPCQVTSGRANRTTFAATVTPTTNVSWLVNGVLGGNATFGTISATGVYTAPLTPPVGSIVTVTAASSDFPQSAANATVAIAGFSTSSFQGQFAFSLSGKNASGAFFRAGSFSADGAGHLTGGLEDINPASCVTTNPFSFVGTYTIGADGRGTLQFADGCTPSIFSFVLINNHQLHITGFDSAGTATGRADLQDSTFFNAAGLTGTYVFDFGGVHGSSTLSRIGQFTSDGLGNITNGSIDTNDGGAISPQVPFTGSYTVNSNGRGTATFGSLNFSFYIVSRGSAKFVGTDSPTAVGAVSGASNQQFANGGLFDKTSLKGNIAFLLMGPVPNGTIATAGSFVADGNGNLTSGVLDENVNGAVTSNAALSSGSYTPAPDGRGRGVATFTAGGHTYNFVFYLSTPGNAVVQEVDSGRTSEGSFVQQQGTSFSVASIQGNYALETTGLSAASSQTIAGELSVDGMGAISSGTLDINTAGTAASEAVTGAYTVPAMNTNGRGTLTLIPPLPSTDNRIFAIYVVNSTQVFVIGADVSVARLASGAMYKRF